MTPTRKTFDKADAVNGITKINEINWIRISTTDCTSTLNVEMSPIFLILKQLLRLIGPNTSKEPKIFWVDKFKYHQKNKFYFLQQT